MADSEETDGRGDARLLLLGRAGDEDAFLALYRRHNAAIFRFALHMSGSREVAEEVVQEVFVALLANNICFSEERGALEGFLIGMARNQVRRLSRRLPGIQCPLKPEMEPLFTSCVLESRLENLRAAILSLPETYRAVTILCDLEELTYIEAAQRLSCAVGTVRSRLHRARAILEAKLRRSEKCPIPTSR